MGGRSGVPANGGTGAGGLLPAPPDDAERDSYARRHLWVLTLLSLLCLTTLAVSQFRFTATSPLFWLFAPVLALALADQLISIRLDTFSPGFDPAAHRALADGWRPERYPDVDVLLPVCGEPSEVLRNTWHHVTELVRHYPGEAVPWVLDDSAGAEAAALAAEFGFRHVVRPDRGRHKKAGNLNHALGLSRGEYVLILDADFAPRPDLLTELLPHLAADPAVGIVQSPQFFRVLHGQNWIERGAGAVQELFYRSVQVSRQRSGGAICVGSCAVYRRSALDRAGGIARVDHSEDIHTSFELAGHGYRLSYLPLPLATGVCPDSLPAFLNQQYRWCNGSLSLVTGWRFWEAELPFDTRLCFVSGFLYYLQTAVLTFAAPLLPIAVLLLRPDLLEASQTVWLLPSLVYATVVLPAWHRAPYRLEAWAVRLVYGWAHVFAIWDLLRGRAMGWRPTGSGAARQGDGFRRFWIGLYGWSATTAVLWVGLALWRLTTLQPRDFGLILAVGLCHALVVGRVLLRPGTAGAAA